MRKILFLLVVIISPSLLSGQSSQKLSLSLQFEGRITPIPLSQGSNPELQSRNQPYYNSHDNLTGLLLGLRIGHQLWDSNFGMGITWLGRYDHIIYENAQAASNRISTNGFMSDVIIDLCYNQSIKNYHLTISCGFGLMNLGSNHTYSYQVSSNPNPVEVNDSFNYSALVPKLELSRNRVSGFISMVIVPQNDFMYQLPEFFMTPSIGVKYRFLTLSK